MIYFLNLPECFMRKRTSKKCLRFAAEILAGWQHGL
jgi:hypothetical protein